MDETTLLADRVSIAWVQGPIAPTPCPTIEGAGTVLSFRGVVRPYEEGRLLQGLDYTCYNPMAEHELRRLAKCAVESHQLHHVRIVHSLGFVAINKTSLLLTVASKHRKAALLASDEVLNDLKRDVPIWKSPVYADDPEGDV